MKKIINFIAIPFVRLRIHPNIVSFIGLLMTVGVVYFVSNSCFYLSALFILLNGFFDTLDGTIARLSGRSSKMGTLVDRTIDKVSEAIIFSSFIIFGFVDLELGLYTLSIVLIAAIISTNIEILLGKELYAPLLAHLKFLKFFRVVAMIVFTALGRIDLMFFLVAVIATYSVVLRLIKVLSYNRLEKD